VKKYQSVNPTFAGPNCWNLALVMKGILPNLRYSTPEEMAFYMQPPLCRQLKNNEAKMPGDVGAIRELNNSSTEEYHGFIYISEEVAYSKNGYMNANPYALQTLDNVFNVYGVTNKNECKQNELGPSSQCRIAVSYHRCISMDQYLKENPNTPKEILTSLNTIKNFEGCLEARAIKNQPFNEKAQDVLENSAKALTFYLEKELKTNKQSNPIDQEKRNFLLGSLQLRLLAMSQQLSNTYDGGLSNATNNLAINIDKSLKELKKQNK
jgi:hypothetical protein